MGEETDGVVESTSKLQEKLKALTGVDIVDMNGAYKDTYTILKEIGSVWKDLDPMDQAAALELMAGKNRANTLAAILNNMKDLEGAYNDALKAEGSALKENEAYLNSIQGRIDLFNNAVQTMWMNLIDSSVVKGVVDIGTVFIKFLDSGAGKVAALSAAIAVFGKVLKANAFSSANGELQIFGKTIDTIRNNFTKLSAESTGVFGKLKAGLASVFTDGNKIDISKILSQDTFDNELTKAIDIFKSQGQVIDEVNWGKYVDGVSQADAAMGAALKTCKIQNGTIIAGSNAYQVYTGAATGAAVGTSAVGGAAQKTTGQLIAMKVAALAANAALTLGLSLLVSLAVQGISAWANAGEAAREAAQNAVNASEAIRDQTESLENYKVKIDELRETLDKGNLSEEEAYDTREQLITIQNELIDKYGEEAKGINLVTGELEKQKAVIDSFSQKESQQWLNTHKSEYLDAIEYFNSENKGSFLDPWYEEFGATRISNYAVPDEIKKIVNEFALTQDNMDAWTNNLGFHNVDFNGSVEEVKTQVEDFISFLNEQEEKLNEEIGNAEINGDLGLADTLRANLKSLQDYQKDIGKEYTNWFGSDSVYAANKAVMEEAQYQTAMAKYTDQYMAILDAQNKLTEAQAKGDPEGIKTAINNYKDAINKAMGDADETWMDDYFNSFADGLAEQEFEINVKLNEDGLQDELAEIVQAGGEKGLSALDNNQILDMVDRGLNVEGATDASGQYTAEQISGLVALQAEADKAGISIKSLIGILTNLRIVTGRATEDIVEPVEAITKTYSDIKASVDAFNDVISQTNEIAADGTEVTEEYKNSLKEIGFTEEELSDCFDENNELIVKNSEKLHKLIKDKRDVKKATVAEARAYAQVNYLKIAKQLQAVNKQFAVDIKAKGLDITATSMFTLATLENVDSLKDQLEELDNTIQQFALLEMQLSKTGEAYQDYQDAKDRDAQLSYDETWLEALKTIDNGILSGAVGTAEFEYAVKLIVPEEVYKTKQELGDIDGMIRSIHDYLDGDPLLANWFTVDDESGELSYTIDNARAFIDDLIASGAVIGDSNDFHFADHINGLSDITDALNEYRKSLGLTYDVTEETVAAMLSGAEDFDATWGNMFSDALMNSTDRSATEATRAITENQLAMTDLIEQYKNGEITLEEYNAKQAELINKHQELNNTLSGSRESAAEMCDAFMDINEKLDESSIKLEEYQRLMEKNKDNRNDVGDIIDIETGENLSDKYADELEKYTQFLSQKKALEDQYGTMTTFTVGLALENEGIDLENIETELERIEKEIQSAFETDAVKKLNNELESTHGIIAKINDDGDIEYTVTDATTDDQMETLKRLDAFKADGTVDINALYSGLTPEQQAEVDKLINLQDKQNLINYYLSMDGTDSAETALDRLVKVIEDIHELMSQSPVFACNTSSASSKLSSLLEQVRSWVGTHVANFVQRVTTIGSTVSGWFNASGNADFSGNSHASGTANNRGKIGLPRAEKDSLVGEFGPELVCANGRYYTVGDHGAEFVDLPKDAIIFNHLQTKQLLNNGHTNSRGKGRGNLSFAFGNAHLTGNAYYGIPSYSPSDKNTSFKDGTDIMDWDDITSGITDAADSISDAADDAEQVVDFIEMKLEEIEAIIEKTTSRIANFLDDTTSIKSKDELYDELVKAEKDKAEVYLKAAQKYDVQAAAALSGVPQQYQEMARNGAIAIKEFLGEDQVEIAEKIEEYRNWAAKADEAENGHLEAIAAISAHRVEQLEDIASDFENIISISQSRSDLLQAEMDFIEESGNRLSESYYEELKTYSQKQLNDMQNERAALQKILDDSVAAGDVIIGSDDWYSMLETINEVDQEIIECKTDLEEFQNAINDLYWDNFDKTIEKLDNINDELSHQYNLISDAENIVDKAGNWTKDGYTSLELLTQQIGIAEQKVKEYDIAINQLKKDYSDGLYSMDEYDEKLAELTDGYYDTIDSIEDTKDAIRDLYQTRFNTTKTGFENIIGISQSHVELLQSEMDFIEESGNRLSEKYYEELKKHSQKQMNDMLAERAALQKILDDAITTGNITVGSDDWHSMIEDIYKVDQEIIDCKTSLEEFQNAINDLYWDNFDKLIAEIDNVHSELSNLYDLVSDTDDVVDEMGNWTDDGITALGLLTQQMENAQFKSQEYGDAIAKLKKDYADGLYSTDEYDERLNDLTESQYDAIKSYEDAKDAIVDLNKTRAEAVKKYMQDEIDKYGELIEKKKESLNTDKEARDFEKSVQESNKNIKDIERQIASLEGNTSSSAMAQRKRLEAELLKAREELNDLYYDHSIEKQQEALDKELEDYTKNKEDQMDALDEYLKKEEQVIADSFDLVTKNTEVIVGTLVRLSEEYGVTISDTIATPWFEGANAIGTYEEQLNTSVSATTANLETLKQHLEDLQTQADKTAESIVAATHSTIVSTNDGHQTSINGYAKGSKSVEYDQWALIDELGDELQLVPNKAGRLDYIKKGTGILNNALTERLMDLAMDPTSMIENSRPVIGTPGITTTNNTFAIDASVGTLLHVEHLDGSNPAEVAKLVDKAWEKKMQTLNNSIKKFTR